MRYGHTCQPISFHCADFKPESGVSGNPRLHKCRRRPCIRPMGVSRRPFSYTWRDSDPHLVLRKRNIKRYSVANPQLFELFRL